MPETCIIDAGVEHLHIHVYQMEKSGKRGPVIRDLVLSNDDSLQNLVQNLDLFETTKIGGKFTFTGPLYITGKLSEAVNEAFNNCIPIEPSAVLWSAAKELQSGKKEKDRTSLGILDVSASGYMAICVRHDGTLKDDLLETNPKCGAGSGINLNRILEKLDIRREAVDTILQKYLSEKGMEKRKKISIRSDRCGVFSSSATISDKNQGIPLDYALAVTMKSEILKACKRIKTVDTVYLTGRIFNWQFARDCARDYFTDCGVNTIIHDEKQSVMIDGAKFLIETIEQGNFREQNQVRLIKPEKLTTLPSFKELKERYESDGSYRRLPDPVSSDFSPGELKGNPVNMALDIGSTMAKMIISHAYTDAVLYKNSYNNHGDTIETIKEIFRDLKSDGIHKLQIQHIGITGSGRYQVQKALLALYPHLGERIFALVENYAHARGSLTFAQDYISELKQKGIPVNEDFCILVDIGGEDTKISIIAIRKNELFDNAMNIKCSAGTGSLMDTLQALFGMNDIREACSRAFNSPLAYKINATCAVFLMENAKKMQARGYSKDAILASCNFAIVENMARTLWNQIELPENAVVLLHGQTMLSDPLPLAVTHKLKGNTGEGMHALVPPLPGHRACMGLLTGIKKQDREIIEDYCDLNDFIEQIYRKKIILCRGAACGDKQACCARTRIVSENENSKVGLTLGGCSAVNEMESKRNRGKKITVTDSYRDIYNFINSKLPESDSPNRLVIPRSFAISEQAFFLAQIFQKLGIPVHCDNVRENDILEAQHLFRIDTCAPNIGAAGQFIRLAGEAHGMILIPQIDYLPTEGASLGRTCTTNQGGVIIARQYAEKKYPDARFLLLPLSLETTDAQNIADQLYTELRPLFDFYGLDISKISLIQAIEYAADKNSELQQEISEMTLRALEDAVKNKLNVSIICSREYVLNPGIYDSHIGKLLRDKGVIALPSYVFQTSMEKKYGYMYWRNPHDILTKIDAIANKRFNEIIIQPELKTIIRKIEQGLTNSLISVVQVSTFRCGPDTVTIPMTTEITKQIPSLFIQSDAMIAELAHLENRVNTHINQLNKRLHQEILHFDTNQFNVEILNDFIFDGIEKESDVLYFPTLGDNRILTSVLRAAGITTIDNYSEDTYDLTEKVKLGREYAGDSVCVPLSAVFGDMLMAVDDFISRKENGDPLVKGKNRILVFMNGGDGPCRLGQYPDVLKLLLYKKFGHVINKSTEKYPIKILVNLTSSLTGKNVYLEVEKWTALQAFQALIVQGVLHSILLKAGGSCKNYSEYQEFLNDYKKMKSDIFYILEKKVKPGRATRSIIKYIEKYTPKLSGIASYFGYGLYNNNGLRKLFKQFSKKWIVSNNSKENTKKIKIHVDGEVYVRVAQIEDIFKVLLDSLGFNSFELTYSPIWCFLEYILENRILVSNDNITRVKENIKSSTDNKEKINLQKIIDEKEQFIAETRNTAKNLRNILASPLYEAANITMPHQMKQVLEEASTIIPSLKPHGELAPYVGEAIIKLREGTNLFLNVAPEGCMVSSMGEMLTPGIMDIAKNGSSRIQHLFSTDGEINEELLKLALIKTLGPEKYYQRN